MQIIINLITGKIISRVEAKKLGLKLQPLTGKSYPFYNYRRQFYHGYGGWQIYVDVSS